MGQAIGRSKIIYRLPRNKPLKLGCNGRIAAVAAVCIKNRFVIGIKIVNMFNPVFLPCRLVSIHVFL